MKSLLFFLTLLFSMGLHSQNLTMATVKPLKLSEQELLSLPLSELKSIEKSLLSQSSVMAKYLELTNDKVIKKPYIKIPYNKTSYINNILSAQKWVNTNADTVNNTIKIASSKTQPIKIFISKTTLKDGWLECKALPIVINMHLGEIHHYAFSCETGNRIKPQLETTLLLGYSLNYRLKNMSTKVMDINPLSDSTSSTQMNLESTNNIDLNSAISVSIQSK
ncbi:hypothetical protein [Marinomonas sp. GJ51-6]|uniref:hypothetical protein n=1 Tax=Marinomonas sp. GJ51-6 TaxID=2992802 RepID=UPI002934B291|nr:hypothetical protein [Marinomonas sp. GJ51-6]WOD06133.1 hypothetical protein ONZ50_10310 [Marinomonas sp. GJ51-6]